MGCDIHLYVEFQIGDHWFTIVKSPFMTRNYCLFNALAGPRGDRPPVYALRGFPPDDSFSDAHNDFFEDGKPALDWHSATWLTPEEYQRVLCSVEGVPIEYAAILSLCRTLEREHPVRLIMWFDN